MSTNAAKVDMVSRVMQSQVVGSRYLLVKKIGQGSFGDIFCGSDIITGEKIAAKVEKMDTRYPQLQYEYKVYRSMKQAQGFPVIRWCGEFNGYYVLVMDLLGESLEVLFNRCGRRFSLKTVLMLAIQMLDRIQHEHENEYLHRDVKPDNFLMGIPPFGHVLYCIDMGLSKRFIDPETREHIPFRDNKKLTGTPRYASINTHHGIEQCRRDDLESLGYMLIYFLVGKLPWQSLRAKTKQEKYDRIGSVKRDTTIEMLCAGQPHEFMTYFHYVRKLPFHARPDYNKLRSLFYHLFHRKGFQEDFIFDWMQQPEYTEHRSCSLAAISKPTKANMPSRRYHYNFVTGENYDSLWHNRVAWQPTLASTGTSSVRHCIDQKFEGLMNKLAILEAERDTYKKLCEATHAQLRLANARIAKFVAGEEKKASEDGAPDGAAQDGNASFPFLFGIAKRIVPETNPDAAAAVAAPPSPLGPVGVAATPTRPRRGVLRSAKRRKTKQEHNHDEEASLPEEQEQEEQEQEKQHIGPTTRMSTRRSTAIAGKRKKR